MVFKEKAKSGYICELVKRKDKRSFPMAFAPNSVITVISFDTACEFCGCHGSYMRNLLDRNRSPESYDTLFGDSFKVYPFYIEDVTVWGVRIPKFYFWIGGNLRQNCLGFDFIHCCGFTHEIAESVVIDRFNLDKYVFDHQDMEHKATELKLENWLQEPLLWFKSLNTDQWEELQKLNPDLYLNFQNGNYSKFSEKEYKRCRKEMGYSID